eukprot:1156412-Pelagomonas_calceolata.AAC.5
MRWDRPRQTCWIDMLKEIAGEVCWRDWTGLSVADGAQVAGKELLGKQLDCHALPPAEHNQGHSNHTHE